MDVESVLRLSDQQSLVYVLAILAALVFMAGKGAEGTPQKVYYASAVSLWLLTAMLANTLP